MTLLRFGSGIPKSECSADNMQLASSLSYGRGRKSAISAPEADICQLRY